jgi:hypothetical protein
VLDRLGTPAHGGQHLRDIAIPVLRGLGMNTPAWEDWYQRVAEDSQPPAPPDQALRPHPNPKVLHDACERSTAYALQHVEREGNMLTWIQEEAPWVIAGLAVIGAILRDLIKGWVTTTAGFIGGAIYHRLAGSGLLRQVAVRRYRAAVVAHLARLKIPFRPNDALDLSQIYVPLEFAKSPHPVRYRSSDRCRPQGSRIGRAGSREVQELVSQFARDDFPGAERFIRRGLGQGTLLVLLDGLDEVSSADRSEVAAVINDFMALHKRCPMVLTCRAAAYREEYLPRGLNPLLLGVSNFDTLDLSMDDDVRAHHGTTCA